MTHEEPTVVGEGTQPEDALIIEDKDAEAEGQTQSQSSVTGLAKQPKRKARKS